MKKILFCLFLCFPFGYSHASAEQSTPKLILISIDGLSPKLIQKAKQRGISLPLIDSFIREGSYAQDVRGVFPTLTYPAHTTLLTGVTPQQHGITHNIDFDKEDVRQWNWHWFSKNIRVPTLWDRAKKHGLRTANVDWPVSVGAPVDFNIVQYWSSNKRQGSDLLQSLSTHGLVESLEPKIGSYPAGDWSLKGDIKRLQFSREIISRYKPDFMTIYFASLDDAQHHFGPNSQEAYSTLSELDKNLGSLLETIHKTYQGEAYVALVSDHGHRPIYKAINLNSALAQEGYIQLGTNNQVLNWTVYSLSGEGFTEIRLRNRTDKPKIRRLLTKFASNPQNGVAEIIEQPPLADSNTNGAPAFILMSAPGYVFRDDLTGSIISSKVIYASSHGFTPSDPDMYSCFYIIGPKVPKHKNLGTISILNIAPTLAHLMGIQMKGTYLL